MALLPPCIQLSFLVHPDKNLDDKDRAQKAFEGISNYCPPHTHTFAFIAPPPSPSLS